MEQGEKFTVDYLRAYGQNSLETAGLLRGILKVLIDTHTMDMSETDGRAYTKSVNEEMNGFRRHLIELAKVN